MQWLNVFCDQNVSQIINFSLSREFHKIAASQRRLTILFMILGQTKIYMTCIEDSLIYCFPCVLFYPESLVSCLLILFRVVTNPPVL